MFCVDGQCIRKSKELFMSSLEEMLSRYKVGSWVWYSYFDNVLLIWMHGEEKLHCFIELINSCHQAVKFYYRDIEG